MCSNSNGSLDELRGFLETALLKFCNHKAGAPVYIGLPWTQIKSYSNNLACLKNFGMTWSSLPVPLMLDKECFRECVAELFPDHDKKVKKMDFDPMHHHAYSSFLKTTVLYLFGLLAKTNPTLDWAQRHVQNTLLLENVLDNFLYYPMGLLISDEFETYLQTDQEHLNMVPKALKSFINEPKRCGLFNEYEPASILSYSNSFYHAVRKLKESTLQRKRVAPVEIDLLFGNTTANLKAAKSTKVTPTQMLLAGPPNGQETSVPVFPSSKAPTV